MTKTAGNLYKLMVPCRKLEHIKMFFLLFQLSDLNILKKIVQNSFLV